MRQYAVILVGLVVLIGAFVARKYVAPAGEPVVAQQDRGRRVDALQAADAVVAGLRAKQAAGPLERDLATLETRCQAVLANQPTPAAKELCGQAPALVRSVRGQTVAEAATESFAAAADAMRRELGP